MRQPSGGASAKRRPAHTASARRALLPLKVLLGSLGKDLPLTLTPNRSQSRKRDGADEVTVTPIAVPSVTFAFPVGLLLGAPVDGDSWGGEGDVLPKSCNYTCSACAHPHSSGDVCIVTTDCTQVT